MNFNNYTIKAQEALQKAAEIASGYQQQGIEPAHLLKAVLQADENMISFVLNKLSINRNQLESNLEAIIQSYPKVSGQQPYLGNDAAAVLRKAEGYLKEFGDEYVAVEHILLALLDGKGKTAQLMKQARIRRKRTESRYSRTARWRTGHRPERRGEVQVAGTLFQEPEPTGQSRKDRSRYRAR